MGAPNLPRASSNPCSVASVNVWHAKSYSATADWPSNDKDGIKNFISDGTFFKLCRCSKLTKSSDTDLGTIGRHIRLIPRRIWRSYDTAKDPTVQSINGPGSGLLKRPLIYRFSQKLRVFQMRPAANEAAIEDLSRRRSESGKCVPGNEEASTMCAGFLLRTNRI